MINLNKINEKINYLISKITKQDFGDWVKKDNYRSREKLTNIFPNTCEDCGGDICEGKKCTGCSYGQDRFE